MRFKMNRLSRAIKQDIVSTEGTASKAIDLIDSWRSELEAFGCRGASISACCVNNGG